MLRRLLAAGLMLGATGGAALAQPAPSTVAPRAILMDVASGQVLFDRNADQATAPASLTKLMTAEIVFARLKTGEAKIGDVFVVSDGAPRSVSGATMGLKAGARVTLGDLLKGLIVQSGNDAAVVLAEGIAGTVPAFVALMNRRAREIGLNASRFSNPHGLPGGTQTVTMRDMALLAAHLTREYPDLYRLFGEREFVFGGVTYRNRNPLLAFGADGLKTGQTAQAGFALVASAERDGRRVILAMNGLKSAAEREAEGRRLLEAGLKGAGPEAARGSP